MAPTTAAPTRAPTPTPEIEFEVLVAGGHELYSLDHRALEYVFGEAIGTDYNVTVSIGAIYTQAPSMVTNHRHHERRMTEIEWMERRANLIEGKQTQKVRSFDECTMGNLFKYQRIVTLECENVDPIQVVGMR